MNLSMKAMLDNTIGLLRLKFAHIYDATKVYFANTHDTYMYICKRFNCTRYCLQSMQLAVNGNIAITGTQHTCYGHSIFWRMPFAFFNTLHLLVLAPAKESTGDGKDKGMVSTSGNLADRQAQEGADLLGFHNFVPPGAQS